jgi:hypothetical protein
MALQGTPGRSTLPDRWRVSYRRAASLWRHAVVSRRRALHAWVARVDRHYLGRSWSKAHRSEDRMKGVVFFENNGGYEHAHLVVRPPAGASRAAFGSTRFLFQPHPNRHEQYLYPRPVTMRGAIKMWHIGPTCGAYSERLFLPCYRFHDRGIIIRTIISILRRCILG